MEFLRKYSYWFLFIVLEICSLILLFRFNSYQGSVWFSAANDMAAEVNGIYTEASSFVQLRDVNKQLTEQNLRLQMQLSSLRDALDKTMKPETTNDRLVMDSLKGYELIPARVVSNSIVKNENYIVIEKGEADGGKTEMGVVGGGGVVGIVFLTAAHHALVLPTINVKSNISCRIRHQRYFGYLRWEGGSTLYAYLNDIPRYAKIKEGEYIETSGYSAVFPPGIFVGKVKSIANEPDGQSLQLKVNLGTDFGNLSDVAVIVNQNQPEIESLKLKLTDFEATDN